jgi:hypothetical protein
MPVIHGRSAHRSGSGRGPVRGPGDREPAADLVRPVAGQFDFLIVQIHTLSTSPRSSMEEPPVELLVDVAHPGTPMKCDKPPALTSATRSSPT